MLLKQMSNFWTLILLINVFRTRGSNTCVELKSGQLVSFCCNNHEEKNGQCVECDVGLVSTDGQPCIPCPFGRYGRRCIYECACHASERCDHKTGCKTDTTDSTELTHSRSEKNKLLTTELLHRATKRDYATAPYTKARVTYKIDRTTPVTRKTFSETTLQIQTEQSKDVLSEREKIVYSVSVCGFVVLIGMFCLYCCYKKYYTHNVNDNNNRVDDHRPESLYETINEEEMTDVSIIHAMNEQPVQYLQVIYTDSEKSESSSSYKSGYLNPYQEIVEDNCPHHYDITATSNNASVLEHFEFDNRNSYSYESAMHNQSLDPAISVDNITDVYIQAHVHGLCLDKQLSVPNCSRRYFLSDTNVYFFNKTSQKCRCSTY